MNIGHKHLRMSEQTRLALANIGAEPLTGSGFENETPDPEFSDSEPAAAPPPR
jgi:hypothetical protein